MNSTCRKAVDCCIIGNSSDAISSYLTIHHKYELDFRQYTTFSLYLSCQREAEFGCFFIRVDEQQPEDIPCIAFLRNQHPLKRIVAFTELQLSTDFVVRVAKAGADSVICLEHDPNSLRIAIEQWLHGQSSPNGQSTHTIPNFIRERLTSIELKLLELVLKNLLGKEIVSRLGVSLRTIYYHKRRICEKLRVRDQFELREFVNRCSPF